jgi:ABC-2 type transport system permease protein
MKLYFELLKYYLKVYFEYRWGLFISVILDPLLLILYVSLLNSLYTNNHSTMILGYTCPQMIWYFAGTMFFYMLVFSQPDKNLSDGVTTGDLNMWLIKPMSILKLDFIKCISNKFCGLVFEFIPCFIIFTFIAFPDFLTFFSFVKYGIISILAFIMFYLVSFSMGTIAFSWQSTNALQVAKMIIINFIAGAFIPIEFFPNFLQTIVKALPFQYLLYVPIQFLLNKPEVQGWVPFAKVLIIQMLWILGLFVITRILLSKMIKKFSAVGG